MRAALAALLLAAPAAAAETPFEAAAERFADADACTAYLALVAADARQLPYDAVEGPYELAAGDVRIHMVRADGNGHRIQEQRCLAEKLSGRSWTHSMEPDPDEFTIESVTQSAEWLKHDRSKQ